jgi:hypothetical protein
LKNRKHSDHYVPRFYLNEFSAKSDNRRAPSVWLYDLENPTPKLVATTRIAKIKNLYSLEDNGSAVNALDEALKHFESEVAPIFRSLRTGEASFAERKRRYVLARFICFLACRIPQFNQNINILFQNKQKSRLIEYFGKDLGWDNVLKKLEEQTGHKFTLKEFLDSFNKMKIWLKPSAFHYLLLESAKRMIPPLGAMKWHFLRSNPDSFYITSDAPVVMVDPNETDPTVRYGYVRKSIQIIVPINRNLCLLAAWAGKEGYYQVTEEVVSEMNTKIADHAMRYLFSPIQFKISVTES